MKNIVVDFGKLSEMYNNCTRNNNWCDDFHFPESYPRDLEYMSEEGIGGGKLRIWLKLENIYNEESGEYNFERYYRYIETAASRNEELLINVDIESKRDTKKWAEPVKKILLHYKERFCNIVYVECLNEPDLIKVDVDVYYKWYCVLYEAVRYVNGTDGISGRKLLLGGPALSAYNREYLNGFLSRYADDLSTDKLLDFIAIHEYAGDIDGDGPIRYEHINRVYKIRNRIEEILVKYSVAKDIPLFITESGVFPGERATDNYADDMYAQSAGSAVITAMYASSGENNHLFHWAVRHKTNPRKNVLAEGKLNELTVYGQLLKLLEPMKGRIAEVSPGYDDYVNGPGAFATSDGEELFILLWNYNYVNYTRGNEEVELKVKGLPFGSDNVRIETRDLKGCEEVKVIAPTEALEMTFTLERNSVMLIKLVRDNIKVYSQPTTTLTETVKATVRNRLNKNNVCCLPEIRDVISLEFEECINGNAAIERSFDGVFWEEVYSGAVINGELTPQYAIAARYVREKNGRAIKKVCSKAQKWLLGCSENQNPYVIKGDRLLEPAILNGRRACLIMATDDKITSFTVSVKIGENTKEDAVLKLTLFDERDGWREYTSVGVTKETGSLTFEIYGSFVKCIRFEAYSEVQINEIKIY